MDAKNTSRKTVLYGEREIQFILERKPVKNLNLRIRRDGSVYVSANEMVPIDDVYDFIRRKGSFICKTVDRFQLLASNIPHPKQYVSGETFIIQGRALRLRVQKADVESIWSDGVYLQLSVIDSEDYDKKKRMLTDFLDKQRKSIFEDVLRTCYPIFQKYGISYPKLRIREMDTRWGSCLVKKGVITLNKRLIEVPRNCIEYVVAHEYCHFIHPDHSKRFYAFLTMIMPDWRERKSLLDKYADYWL